MFTNACYNLCLKELWTLETYKIENQEQNSSFQKLYREYFIES